MVADRGCTEQERQRERGSLHQYRGAGWRPGHHLRQSERADRGEHRRENRPGRAERAGRQPRRAQDRPGETETIQPGKAKTTQQERGRLMNPAAVALAVLAWYAAKQPEPADLIMARVALNQDRAQQMRSAFVYHQNMLIRFKRSNHKLAREEQREYVVTPTEKGFTKTLTH